MEKDSLDRYRYIKQAAEDSRRQADKAAGALEQLQAQIQEKYKVKTLTALKSLIEEEETLLAEEEARLEQLLDKFESKYGDRLNEI